MDCCEVVVGRQDATRVGRRPGRARARTLTFGVPAVLYVIFNTGTGPVDHVPGVR